jgi:enterochelin esterase family protein
MLHAHRLFPGHFNALFMQSGSFLRPDLDPQERRFSRFGPVTRFISGFMRSERDPDPIPTVLTCGIAEENVHNNRLMAWTLGRLGYPVQLYEVRDAHNYTAWRDALDPYLTELVINAL